MSLSRAAGRPRRAGAALAIASSACGRLHRDAVAQLQLARGHDQVVRADAAAHFDARVFALADLHFGQRDAAVGDAIDEVPFAFRNDRVLRHQHRLRVAIDDQRDAREQPRPQLVALIRQARANHDGAAVDVDFRFDRIHRAVECLRRKRIDSDGDVLPGHDVGQIDLADAEIDLQEIDVDEIHQHLTDVDEVADADGAQTDDAVERREDARLIEPGARELQAGVVRFELRFRAIAHFDRRGLLLDQQLRALVGEFGDLAVRGFLGDFGGVHRIVERDQRCAFA